MPAPVAAAVAAALMVLCRENDAATLDIKIPGLRPGQRPGFHLQAAGGDDAPRADAVDAAGLFRHAGKQSIREGLARAPARAFVGVRGGKLALIGATTDGAGRSGAVHSQSCHDPAFSCKLREIYITHSSECGCKPPAPMPRLINPCQPLPTVSHAVYRHHGLTASLPR